MLESNDFGMPKRQIRKLKSFEHQNFYKWVPNLTNVICALEQIVTLYINVFQNGKECFCGDGEDLDKGPYKVSTGCNKICRGNQGEKCGGSWRLSVYYIQTGTNWRISMYTVIYLHVCAHFNTLIIVKQTKAMVYSCDLQCYPQLEIGYACANHFQLRI